MWQLFCCWQLLFVTWPVKYQLSWSFHFVLWIWSYVVYIFQSRFTVLLKLKSPHTGNDLSSKKPCTVFVCFLTGYKRLNYNYLFQSCVLSKGGLCEWVWHKLKVPKRLPYKVFSIYLFYFNAYECFFFCLYLFFPFCFVIYLFRFYFYKKLTYGLFQVLTKTLLWSFYVFDYGMLRNQLKSENIRDGNYHACCTSTSTKYSKLHREWSGCFISVYWLTPKIRNPWW